MHDILFTLPGLGIPIHTYGVMAMLGFLAAVLVARWRAKKVGISQDAIFDIAMWALIAGLLGSRVAFVIQNADHYFNTSRPDYSFLDLFKIWEGGLVFYGGFIGAFIAVIVVTRMKKLRLLAVWDVVAPSLALGHALGRVGCFMRGCCYGVPVAPDAWYGVVFPKGSLPYYAHAPYPIPDGTPIFPSQIVSSFDLLVIFAILMLFFKHRRAQGQVAGLYLILYSIHRFTIEFFRSGAHAPGELSQAQWISIGAFFFGLGLLAYVSGRGLPAPQPPAPTKGT